MEELSKKVEECEESEKKKDEYAKKLMAHVVEKEVDEHAKKLMAHVVEKEVDEHVKNLMAHVVEKEVEKKEKTARIIGLETHESQNEVPSVHRDCKVENGEEKTIGSEISKMVSFNGVGKEDSFNNNTSSMEREMLALMQLRNNVGTYSETQKERNILKYEERADGLYVGGKCIMNAIISIKSMEVLKRENGFCLNKFKCLVNTAGIQTELLIPVEEFRDGKWLKRCPYVTFKCQKNKAFDFIFIYLNTKIETENYSIERMFETSGWKAIEGKMLYVTRFGVISSDIGVKSLRGSTWRLTASRLNDRMRFEQFLKMRLLTPQTPTATILQLYTLQSFMYTLYLQANAVPKFCIFLEGPKGTHKTSLALAMTQTGGVKAPTYTFTASTAGLEAGFADYHDAVMLVDDLMPVESIKTRKLIEGNLEFLTRLFGDATGKMRNLDFCDNSGIGQYKTHGGCVFTGEYYIGCGSSLARTIKLHCKAGNIDTMMLTEYQQNPEILDEFLYSFVSYITGRFGDLVTFVGKYFDEKRRSMYSNFSNPRYAEYFAQLMCCAEIFSFYGRDIGCISEQDRVGFINSYENAVIQVLQNNDLFLRDEEPVVKVAKALYEAYENRDVNKRLGLNFLQDENFYHISEAELLQCYTYFIHRYGIEEISSKAKRLVNLLANVGAVEAAMEGGTKRYATKMSGYGNKRFLHIKKDKIFALAGEQKEAIK